MLRIALTFDDGPNTVTTPEVLDLLQEYGIPASFFLISSNITDESARMVRRAVAMGCEINNHTVSHRFMNQLSREEIRGEIRVCSEKITEITGVPPRFFRPPFIVVNDAMYEEIPLPFICGVGCRDWEPAVSAQERIDLLRQNVHDGNLVLLHDMKGNENTVEALRVMIPEWLEQGAEFFTCSGLFEAFGITPRHGVLYSSVHDGEGA